MAKTYPSERTIKAILAKPTITIDTALIRSLGYEDIRDFTYELGNWGHNTDFTYNEVPTQRWQSYLRAFIKSFSE